MAFQKDTNITISGEEYFLLCKIVEYARDFLNSSHGQYEDVDIKADMMTLIDRITR